MFLSCSCRKSFFNKDSNPGTAEKLSLMFYTLCCQNPKFVYLFAYQCILPDIHIQPQRQNEIKQIHGLL